MALPKFRTSRARKKWRQSHHALQIPNLVTCSHCGASMQPHRVCLACGHYKGKQIINFDMIDV